MEIIVRLHCRNLPGTNFEGRDGVRLGIQRGKVIADDMPGDAQGVTFTVPLRVTGDAASGPPNFLGPFAHGAPGARFLYLCWGERIGDEWAGFRRAKVPLKGLSWERLRRHLDTDEPVDIALDMTDAKGGPVCGSVEA